MVGRFPFSWHKTGMGTPPPPKSIVGKITYEGGGCVCAWTFGMIFVIVYRLLNILNSQVQ